MRRSYEIFKDANKKFRFRLKNSDYETLLVSTQLDSISECQVFINMLKVNVQFDSQVLRQEDGSGHFLTVGMQNFPEIARSESFPSFRDLDHVIAQVRTYAPFAEVVDLTA